MTPEERARYNTNEFMPWAGIRRDQILENERVEKLHAEPRATSPQDFVNLADMLNERVTARYAQVVDRVTMQSIPAAKLTNEERCAICWCNGLTWYYDPKTSKISFGVVGIADDGHGGYIIARKP